MLKGKNILLGVTGGIAAYKAAELTSLLIKQHANVDVIMTENATKFIAPLTFEQLTGNKVYTDTFDRNFVHHVEHIALADKADILVIVPATANIIGKVANGIADDMLSTTTLACACPKIIAPAMNTKMYTNPVMQNNLDKLKKYNWTVIEPSTGRLACGSNGIGKLQDVNVILQSILYEIAFDKDLKDITVLVTAGPTQESIDPVRYITNHSTGKMGYSIAKMAMLRGARVILISGETHIDKPPFMYITEEVKSAAQMFNAVQKWESRADIIIKSAAVADYTPIDYSDNKVKKSDDDLSIQLKRTEDILNWLGHKKRDGQVIVGFSMETENMLENSRKKLHKKNVDMICANNLKVEGAGFGTDTNIITLITADDVEELPIMSKEDAANKIIDKAVKILDNLDNK